MAMQQAFQIRTQPMYQREKPERNPLYTRWIKRFACLGCGSTWNVDPCHTGPHGHGQKSSDYSCIPLCRKCHDKFDADPQAFAILHDLDVPAAIRKFRQLWKHKIDLSAASAARPSGRVQPADSAAEGDLCTGALRPLSESIGESR